MVQMNELTVFILVNFCIIAALFQIFRWFNRYSNITRQSFKIIFEKGFYMPRNVNSDKEDIDKEDVKILNRIHISIYLFMFLGIGIIITYMTT